MRWNISAALMAVVIAACGGAPVLSNVPHASTPVVAGLGALAAGAATLMDPGGAANLQEVKKPEQREPRVSDHRETVPPDVLDRLDKADAKKENEPENEPAPTTQPAPPKPAYMP